MRIISRLIHFRHLHVEVYFFFKKAITVLSKSDKDPFLDLSKRLWFYSMPVISNESAKLAMARENFLTYETEFVLFLAVLENSVLPMG